jgi:hypothetical protein
MEDQVFIVQDDRTMDIIGVHTDIDSAKKHASGRNLIYTEYPIINYDIF